MLPVPFAPPILVSTPNGMMRIEHFFPAANTPVNRNISNLFQRIIAKNAFQNLVATPAESADLCHRISLTPTLATALSLLMQNTHSHSPQISVSVQRALFQKADCFDQIAVLFDAIPLESRDPSHFNMFIERALQLGNLQHAYHALLLAKYQKLANAETFSLLITDAFKRGSHQEAYSLFQETILLEIVTEDLFALVITEAGKNNYMAAANFFAAAAQLGMSREKVYNAIITAALNSQIDYHLIQQLFAQALLFGFIIDTGTTQRFGFLTLTQQNRLVEPVASNPPTVPVVKQDSISEEQAIQHIQRAKNANPFDRQTVVDRIQEARQIKPATVKLYVFLITTAHGLGDEELTDTLCREANNKYRLGTLTGNILAIQSIRLG